MCVCAYVEYNLYKQAIHLLIVHVGLFVFLDCDVCGDSPDGGP